MNSRLLVGVLAYFRRSDPGGAAERATSGKLVTEDKPLRIPGMRVYLEKISPLAHVAKIAKPMLIGQGFNDPRVPVGEAERIVSALKANGFAPWYFLAMDEGHGFAKKDNATAFQNATMAFIEKQFFKR